MDRKHGRRLAHLPLKNRAKTPNIIGKEAYSIVHLQRLITCLSSRYSAVQMAAVAEFAENWRQISLAVEKHPEVSPTEMFDLFISALIKNQEKIMEKFQKEKRKESLAFLSASPNIPEEIRTEAELALKQMKSDVLSEKLYIPSMVQESYPTAKIENLVTLLESPEPAERISAAIEFIQKFPCIVETVSQMPMLSVTSVTKKAMKVIRDYPKIITDTMKEGRMVPELLFIAARNELPPAIRKEVNIAAIEIKKGHSPLELVSWHTIPQFRSKAENVPTGHEIKAPSRDTRVSESRFTISELEAMMVNFDSPVVEKAVGALVDFFSNYDKVIELVSKTPLLTVTEVAGKAVKSLENNFRPLLERLERTGNSAALAFLATSEKIPAHIRARASAILVKLSERQKKKEGGPAGSKEKP